MLHAEASADKYHGVAKFDVVSGKQDKGPGGGPPAYQNVFGETLAKLADSDPAYLRDYSRDGLRAPALINSPPAHPDRSFDVGIAEQASV